MLKLRLSPLAKCLQSVLQCRYWWLLGGALCSSAMAASLEIADEPLPVVNNVRPNVLIILDNSQSMDALMNGAVVAGDVSHTRSNIARRVIKNTIQQQRDRDDPLNWGVMSYALADSEPALLETYLYLMDDATQKLSFTDSCKPNAAFPFSGFADFQNKAWLDPADASAVSRYQDALDDGVAAIPGISGTTGTAYCIPNPDWQTGWRDELKYIKFHTYSDQSSIADVLYDRPYDTASGLTYPYIWGPNDEACSDEGEPRFFLFKQHKETADWETDAFCAASVPPGTPDPTSGTAPDPAANGGFPCAASERLYYYNWRSYETSCLPLTKTDAGYLPEKGDNAFFIARGWGYDSEITGRGALQAGAGIPIENRDEPVFRNAHYANLNALLAPETTDPSSGEIKNAAIYTATAGTLQTAKSYYAGDLDGYDSPIQYSCQNNYVLLLTDGLPTGDPDGNLYPDEAREFSCTWNTKNNSCDEDPGKTFPEVAKAAAGDAYKAVDALRLLEKFKIEDPDSGDDIKYDFDIQTYIIALAETVANKENLSIMNALAYAGSGSPEAFLATEEAQLQEAIVEIAENIMARIGSGSTATLSNDYFQIGDVEQIVYETRYNSVTWTGDVVAFYYDPDEKKVNAERSPWTNEAGEVESVRTLLEKKDWQDRLIFTASDVSGVNQGIPFVWENLSADAGGQQERLLSTAYSDNGEAIVNYLRGSQALAGTAFRRRPYRFGDVVGAQVVQVKQPDARAWYSAEDEHEAFRGDSVITNRPDMLYVGANDGMLHAIKAATGEEAWAYIPNLVIDNLGYLTRRQNFSHHYYVGATPNVSDVDFGHRGGDDGAPDWHTVLAGGLGKGGRGYYALDVSRPDLMTSQASAASQLLWEFPHSVQTEREAVSKNVGYSYGKPQFVKTEAYGWVVLVTSGYNNGSADTGGDGKGYLFVLDAKTGDLVRAIATPGCHSNPAANPCGLAHVTPFVQIESGGDNYVGDVFGGDLYGNVWRFDLSGEDIEGWSVSRFARLTETSSGNPQPITTEIEIRQNATSTYVLVGTGKYLGMSDFDDKQVQSVYGLIDKGLEEPVVKSQLLAQQFGIIPETEGQQRLASGLALSAEHNGWYIDLSDSGERVNTSLRLTGSTMIFSSNVPSRKPCIAGGHSWLNYLSWASGGIANVELTYSSVKHKGISNGVASFETYDQGGNLLGTTVISSLDRVGDYTGGGRLSGGGTGENGSGSAGGSSSVIDDGGTGDGETSTETAGWDSLFPKRQSWREVIGRYRIGGSDEINRLYDYVVAAGRVRLGAGSQGRSGRPAG